MTTFSGRWQQKRKNAITHLLIGIQVASSILIACVNLGFAQELAALFDKTAAPIVRYKVDFDPVGLETFCDRFFRDRMAELHVPGAVVLVVKSGNVVLKKGYGFSNLELRESVDPDRTLLRVGSISKLLTATAVMQLAERGKLKLTDRVNEHLTLFQIPNQHPNPITVASLLTHTAGFDQCQVGRSTTLMTEIEPLGEVLRELMPRVAYNPGTVTSYSNYGIALAGHLVEEASSLAFEDFMQTNILQPLQMSHSSFQTPVDFNPDFARGYRYKNGSFKALPIEYSKLPPAGSLTTTAADLAKFMFVHLQGGRYSNVSILSEGTIQEMHRQQFTSHPAMPGWCYGFYERYTNGRRAILHSGNPRGYSSLLYLMPGENLGFFVFYNSNDTRLYEEFTGIFLDRYFPGRAGELPPSLSTSGAASNAERVAGSYRPNDFPKHSFTKVVHLLAGEKDARVRLADDGRLAINLSNRAFKTAKKEPYLFETTDSEMLMIFSGDAFGKISTIYNNAEKPVTLERISWWETYSTQRLFLKAFLVIFACFPIMLLFYRKEDHRMARWSLTLSTTICGLNLIFLVGLTTCDYDQLRYGIPLGLRALLILPVITTSLCAGLPFVAVHVWKTGKWSFCQRLHYAAMALAAFAFIPFLSHWNLLGFHF